MNPIVIANWKMHTGLADADILATMVKNGLEHESGVDVVLCPPFIWLHQVAQVLEYSAAHINMGAQDCFYEPDGAYTGEVSASMLKDLCKYVIVGHSERRKYFGETDEIISAKVAAVLSSGMTPILCIGETEKSEGSVKQVLNQLKGSLAGINKEDYSRMIVAYEPVWSISSNTSGEVATGEYANKICSAIKDEVGNDCRVIYGGSANEKNAGEFLLEPSISGLLVGAASLKAKDFIAVCHKAAKARA